MPKRPRWQGVAVAACKKRLTEPRHRLGVEKNDCNSVMVKEVEVPGCTFYGEIHQIMIHSLRCRMVSIGLKSQCLIFSMIYEFSISESLICCP